MIRKCLLILVTCCVLLSGCYVVDYSLSGLENGLGDKYLRGKEYDKSINHYRNAYKFDREGPFGERAYFKLSLVYKITGKIEQSLEILKNIASWKKSYNYKVESLIELSNIYYNKEDYLVCEDYLDKIKTYELTDSQKSRYAALTAKLDSVLKNNDELRNLKKLYIEYKTSYDQYRQLIIAPPGIKNFLPTEDILKFQELFIQKKNKYEQEKNNIKREQSLKNAKDDYLKAFFKYQSIIPEDPSLFETEQVQKAEMEMRKKFIKWQMIKMGHPVSDESE